ncbi:predicted protein [Lichtheimia corymbifera JMRC:FSU:9682]|uniref:Uncharacterized protein n=1 Tax=Lichtheimia corymbifera JMRC:FSU:9682 TaxID=1263082 RepID=A0A068RHR3_9FUNG|nr:predicted protein [Lichtheimia corymbifera JMRC:FSU:9682]
MTHSSIADAFRKPCASLLSYFHCHCCHRELVALSLSYLSRCVYKVGSGRSHHYCNLDLHSSLAYHTAHILKVDLSNDVHIPLQEIRGSLALSIPST